MKLKVNNDVQHVQKIRAKLKENGGYCPCVLQHNEDTKCICKEFKEQIERNEKGFCHCMLYEIVDDD